MLKRISPRDAALGIYIEAFEGRFSDRPFWQTGFVLTSLDDLQRLRNSAVDAVIIDIKKGSAPSKKHFAYETAGGGAARPAARRPLDPKLKHAARTVEQSRREVMRLADDIRAGRPVSIARLAPTIAQIADVLESDSHAFLKLMRLKQRDEYTYLHSVAVAALMMMFAKRLGIDNSELAPFGLSGLLHDIGKIAMPSEILDKATSLTGEEFALIKTHPQAGAKILVGAELPEQVINACLHHHERVDGAGYPFGLSGEALGLMAKMTTICDVYDAMTSDRFYKDACSPQQALGEMWSEQGHFDRVLLRTFMRSIEIFPIGSLVRIGDNTLAVVIADDPDDPTLPTVRTFYSIRARAMIGLEDVKIGRNGLLDIDDPGNWGFSNWPELSKTVTDSNVYSRAD